MTFQRTCLIFNKLIFGMSLLLPITAFAHLLSITASSPFPEAVTVSTTATATFTVTNISAIPITAIDQSSFPIGSGLSILSSTCGNLMGPAQSCNIMLKLNAPATPQTISAELHEWAKPSADGVQFPFSIAIISKINWTAWTEDPSDPIFNPGTAYYTSVVIYDALKFGDNSAFYKMLYEGNNGIALAYSDDGITWTPHLSVGLSTTGAHPVVVYDAHGFGGGSIHYKLWFWETTAPLTDISAIAFSESPDGVIWTPPVPVIQVPSTPLLVTGISPGYFYHLYGPGYVIYNPHGTSTPGQPMSYPYIMYFDTSTEGLGPGTSVEQLGLAYSTDGLNWSRYGTDPVIVPSGDISQWDGQYIYHPSVIKVQGIYQMFYSGSNGQPIGSDLSNPNRTAHGIGHASSTDGIHWTLDSANPIFYILDGIPWRSNRTYAPAVIFDPFCTGGNSSNVAKMWFSGANSSDTKAIGYATLPCP
ncbi:MAG: hypothetical protein ACHQAX_03470 [Gammaproteobacteria bacterium]